MPKEPAARKPQLPSISKEKLLGGAQRPGSRRRSGDREQHRHSKARTAPDGRRQLRLRRPGGRLRKAPGLGVRNRPGAARAQRPNAHPSPRPRAVGGETGAKEKRDNAGPDWRLRALQGSPAPLSALGPPAAALSSLLGPRFRVGAAKPWRRPPSAWPPPPFSPRGGSCESARRRRASRRERARGRGRARQRRAGERGARRSPRTRCRSGGFSVEAGAAPRFSVRYESWPGRRSLPAILARFPLGSHQEGQPKGPATVSRQGCGRRSAGIPAPAPRAGRESKMKCLSPGDTYPSPVQVQLPRSSGAAGPRPRAPGSVLLTMARPL